jgi:hypothetical protein
MKFPDHFMGKKARKMPDIFERDDEQVVGERWFSQVRIEMEADPKALVPHRREASRYGELPSQVETLDFIKLALYDISIFQGGMMTKTRIH